jgi:membrane-bound lytic murein transglycosylase B
VTFNSKPILAALVLPFLLSWQSNAFARMDNRPEVKLFIEHMVKDHQFKQSALIKQFAAIRSNPKVIKYIRPPVSPTQRSWERYQPRFVNPGRIEAGVKFWNLHAQTLSSAEAEYGVPAEIIVGIIGVETIYGRHMGQFSTLEALSTLAFDYSPRADFFSTELEQFLLLSRENRLDPLSIKGSFAGAIGIPQFMPGSQRRYGVDFDHDGKVDLQNSVADAIGSVARFLSMHGWVKQAPVASKVTSFKSIDPVWLESGILPRLKIQDLRLAGVETEAMPSEPEQCALIDLVSPDQPTEYWLGFDNFYVITRYNRSSFYAMSVFQLAEAIRLQKQL